MSPPLISADWRMETLRDSRLRKLVAQWERMRRHRVLPTRRDVDPAEFADILPYVFMVDVLRDPLDFRFRLAGTNFREVAGLEVTGKRIAEVFPDDSAARFTSIGERSSSKCARSSDEPPFGFPLRAT
jgi:hypothetical protein